MTRCQPSLLLVLLLFGSCNSSETPGCSMVVNNSCITTDKFCDSTGICQSCPSGTFNCDTDNNNACEVKASSCSVVPCSDCDAPNCCDDGFCRGPQQTCSNGGTCHDGACSDPGPKCPDCSAPKCCDNGTCREPDDTCENGGSCKNGGCTLGPCDTCNPPSCCDELVCLAPGDRCADGRVCTSGACYDLCDLCIFPYCCEAGYCLMEGQRCKSGGTCLDASCGPASCPGIAEWTNSGSGSYDAADNVSAMEVSSTTDPTMLLRLELFHDHAAVTPHVVSNERQNQADCEEAGICAWIGTGCSGEQLSSCDKRYLALSGTIEVTHADALASGTMSATIQNAWLVEWDATKDRATKGWQCLELAWAGLSASW